MTLMTPEEEAKYNFKCNIKFDDLFLKCFAGADIDLETRIKKCFEENDEFLVELKKDKNIDERTISELMDVIQSHFSLFLSLIYKEVVTKEMIENWTSKQKERYIKYCKKER